MASLRTYDNEYEIDEDSSDDESCDYSQNRMKELTFEDEESSEDDFEKEMKADLSNVMYNYEQLYTGLSAGGHIISSEKTVSNQESIIEDDGDDDDDNEVGKIDPSNLKSNDELLYDPCSDNLDKQWVEQQRFKYQPRGSKTLAILPQSDAVLNCPCCMTALCHDCQRHEIYNFQYRAMFVRNCKILYNEIKHCPKKGDQQIKTRKRKQAVIESGEGEEDDDNFHPVCCSICDTEVAVIDRHEVFHFYNVLASH